jgi:hypothetical protein
VNKLGKISSAPDGGAVARARMVDALSDAITHPLPD